MPESIIILVMSMLRRRDVVIEAQGAIFKGICNGIEAEDGSGTSFNITICGLVNGTIMTTPQIVYLKKPTGMGTEECPIKSSLTDHPTP